MRLVDADEVKKQIKQMQTLTTAERILFRLALDRTPTYEPPNPPLTLEDLREMGGEPVYMMDLTGGTLWNQWIIFQKSTDDGFIPRGGGFFSAGDYGKTWLAYRRNPEEGTA